MDVFVSFYFLGSGRQAAISFLSEARKEGFNLVKDALGRCLRHGQSAAVLSHSLNLCLTHGTVAANVGLHGCLILILILLSSWAALSALESLFLWWTISSPLSDGQNVHARRSGIHLLIYACRASEPGWKVFWWAWLLLISSTAKLITRHPQALRALDFPN